jgi:bifunctional isochorismate lyase/aryl carrier protein
MCEHVCIYELDVAGWQHVLSSEAAELSWRRPGVSFISSGPLRLMAEDDTHSVRLASSWFPAVAAYEPPLDVAGFNRVRWRLDTARAVLLVHDMQRFWLDRFADPAPLVGRVASLVAASRAAGLPIVYSVAAPAGGPRERGLALERWGPGIAAAGQAGRAIDDLLRPEPQDRVVRKTRYSAFFRTGLELALREAGRSQILIAGVFAHHGCLATALDAYMRDIQAFFIADATADHGHDQHLCALRYVGEVCGCVVTAAEVERALAGQPSGPSAPGGVGA